MSIEEYEARIKFIKHYWTTRKPFPDDPYKRDYEYYEKKLAEGIDELNKEYGVKE